jgi:RNA-binding protein
MIDGGTVPLDNPTRRALKQRAHALKPVVLVGQAGLTDAVLAEIDRALHDHELIKVRVNGLDRDERNAQVAAMASRSGATLVQRIGNVAVLYRERPEGQPKPSNTAPKRRSKRP